MGVHPKIVSDIMEFVHVIGAPMDDSTRLLRLHGLSEYFLERILLRQLPNGPVLTKDERFSYHHKLQVALALDALNSSTVGALRKLTRTRNRCAHERKPKVGLREILDIGEALNPLFAKAMSEFSGENREFRALAWALFTQLSNQTTAIEVAAEKLQIK